MKNLFKIFLGTLLISTANLYAGINGQCSQYSSDIASQRNTLCKCTRDYLEELTNDNKNYDLNEEFKKLNSLKAQKRVIEDFSIALFLKKFFRKMPLTLDI